MKKITRWLLAVSLVWGTAVFTSCSNVDGSSAESFDAAEELSGEKFLHDEWMDRSVKPGDSFWKYALGRWLKKHSQSDFGLTGNVQKSINEEMYAGMSSSKSSGTGHLLKLIAGPTPSPDDETAAVNDVLSLLNDDPDITMEDVIYDAGKLADLRFSPLFGHEILNVDGALRYVLTPGIAAIPSDGFEIMTMDGITLQVVQTFMQWGYDVLSPEMKSSIKAIANIESELHTLEDDWSAPVPTFKGKMRMVKSNSPLLASNLTIRGLSAGDKNLEAAFKKAFHVDNQTYYLPEVKNVFDMLAKYDAAALHDYLRFYTLYRLGQVLFETGNSAEEIYENMNVLMPSIFVEYQTSILCKDADIDGATQMLEQMREKMTDRINNLDWLGTATKQKAIEKLQAMKFNVCGPKKFFNANLKLNGKTPVEDFVQYGRQLDEYNRTVLAGKKVKDYSWEALLNSALVGLSIDNVNSMYIVLFNQIFIFPAYIRSELFPKDKDDVMRYVTLCVFGHEMTHGFDGFGATYDKNGTESNWWTAEDEKKFEERKKQMEDLYSDLDVVPGVKTDGENTLDENIADLGGFNLAWELWNDKLEADGLTGEELRHRQREFFLGYAYLWQLDADEETLLDDRETDNHAANHVRVNGISRLMDDWYTLFGVEPEDELYVKPEDRVKIW